MAWARARAETLDTSRESREREALARLLAPLLAEPSEASDVALGLLDGCGGFATVIRTPGPQLMAAAPGLPAAAVAVLGRLGEASDALSHATAMAGMAPGGRLVPRGAAASRSAPARSPQAARSAAGRWLRRLREAAALSQAELAARIGCPSPTLIDQIEAGHGRIAWSRAGAWSDALGVARPDFAARLLRFYEPELAALLGWPHDPAEAAAPGEGTRDTAA